MMMVTMTRCSSWSRPVAVALLMVATGLALPNIAFAAGPPLTLLGPDTLAVTATRHAATATTFITILNKGATPTTITVKWSASSTSGVAVKRTPSPSVLPAGEATRIKVTLTGVAALSGPAEGAVVVTGGATPIAQPVSITPAPHPAAHWARDIAFGSLIVAALAYLFTALWIRRTRTKQTDGKLGSPAPGPTWDFDTSWATNLTTLGAVFGTVLGAVTLPDNPSQIDKETLIRLNVFFALVVVAAPFVFHALRKPSRASAIDGNGLYGWNATLLISCCLTFGAVVGELATLALLFWELVGGGYRWAGVGGACLAGLLVISYYLATVPFIASTNWQTKLNEANAQADQVQRRRIAEVLSWLERERSELAGTRGLPAPEDVEEAIRETTPAVMTTQPPPLSASPVAAPLRWRLP